MVLSLKHAEHPYVDMSSLLIFFKELIFYAFLCFSLQILFELSGNLEAVILYEDKLLEKDEGHIT